MIIFSNRLMPGSYSGSSCRGFCREKPNTLVGNRADRKSERGLRQVIVVLEGEAALDEGVDTRVVAAGNVVVIPAGQPHGSSSWVTGVILDIADGAVMP